MIAFRVVIILCACSFLAASLNVFTRFFGKTIGPPRPVQRREVVIIGSGPAGATAAIYSARAMLKPLQISGYNAGGQLMLTSDVENFPGYRNAITGPDLMDDLMHQAKKFGTEVWQTDVTRVDFSKRPFILSMQNCTVLADAVIISTGANSIWLNAKREGEFQGKGISTCATCDGFLFRDKCVVVIGGGDSAMEEANFLSRFAKKVTIVHRRDTFRASKIMLERARANPKIHFVCNAEVQSWLGENEVLSGLTYKDTVTGEEHKVYHIYSNRRIIIQIVNIVPVGFRLTVKVHLSRSVTNPTRPS